MESRSFFGFIKDIYVGTFKAFALKTDTACILIAYISLLAMFLLTKILGAFAAVMGTLLLWITIEFFYMFVPDKSYTIGKYNISLPDIKFMFSEDFSFHKEISIQRLPKEIDMYAVYGAASIGWLLTIF